MRFNLLHVALVTGYVTAAPAQVHEGGQQVLAISKKPHFHGPPSSEAVRHEYVDVPARMRYCTKLHLD